MPFEYNDYSPIDCSVEPDLSKLTNKSVLVTGGTRTTDYPDLAFANIAYRQ
jgi:hypothetical protein